MPWLIIIPGAIYYLIRSNYRVNSGLCPKCGSKIEKELTENLYNTDKLAVDIKCNKCSKLKSKSSTLRNVLIFVFIIWAFTSIGIYRRIGLVG